MTRLTVLLALFACACSPTAPYKGRQFYQESCAACHGSDGRGNGPAAAGMSPRPADLTKIAARRDGTWPLLEVMSIIDGYGRTVVPGQNMPRYGDFVEGGLMDVDTARGPEKPVPVAVIALANYLETLQDPKATSTMP